MMRGGYFLSPDISSICSQYEKFIIIIIIIIIVI